MYVQKMDWGRIEWMDDGAGGSGENLSEETGTTFHCGTVYIDPHKILLPHIHYEEQFIYVKEGKGRGYVNGIQQDMVPGAMFHMPVGCTHEIINDEDTPLVHLLVSNPASMDPDSLIDRSSPSLTEDSHQQLSLAIASMRTRFLDHSNLVIIIRDVERNILYKSETFPMFCERNCQISQSSNCACLSQLPQPENNTEMVSTCPYGLSIYQVPILWDDTCIGYVQGGYIRRSVDIKGNVPVYDVPDSSADGLLQLLRKIAKAIRNFCEFDQYKRELFETEKHLSMSESANAQLQTHLRDAEHEVTNLKINNHFLFNTLNSMASMAIEGGQRQLYQSIIDLSKMLRYSVRVQSEAVPIATEIEYLEAYLKLQKLRYQDGLTYSIKADPKVLDCMVPFNFLQPIVENAFTHGFHDEKKKLIRVNVEEKDGKIVLTAENSGPKVSEQRCEQISLQMKSMTSHGMSMIYEKLKKYFGDDLQVTIDSGTKGGLLIRIEIPKEG